MLIQKYGLDLYFLRLNGLLLILIADQRTFQFDKLCICTGCSPSLIASNPDVVGLRDTESVSELTKRLSSARTVAIIGNGGISLELLQKVKEQNLLVNVMILSWNITLIA